MVLQRRELCYLFFWRMVLHLYYPVKLSLKFSPTFNKFLFLSYLFLTNSSFPVTTNRHRKCFYRQRTQINCSWTNYPLIFVRRVLFNVVISHGIHITVLFSSVKNYLVEFLRGKMCHGSKTKEQDRSGCRWTYEGWVWLHLERWVGGLSLWLERTFGVCLYGSLLRNGR